MRLSLDVCTSKDASLVTLQKNLGLSTLTVHNNVDFTDSGEISCQDPGQMPLLNLYDVQVELYEKPSCYSEYKHTGSGVHGNRSLLFNDY